MSEENATKLAANVDATEALSDAAVIVLSANEAFTNERVLKLGEGLSASDVDGELTIFADNELPHALGGFRINFTATAATALSLPTQGRLATTDQPETLLEKTLSAPIVSNIGNYLDDAAAATGGVPVGGIYHNAGALRVRLA